MTSLRENFVRKFERCCPVSWEILHDDEGRQVVSVPCLNSDLGDLHVYIDDEITVCIGSHTHTHFSPWDYIEEPKEKVYEQMIDDSIDYALDVLEGKIEFRLRYKKEKLISAISMPAEEFQKNKSASDHPPSDIISGRGKRELHIRWPSTR